MAPISLKIILDDGAVTRTIQFESGCKVSDAHAIIKEKLPTGDGGKGHGLFLTSADNSRSGIWLEDYRTLEYYMLRNGDSLLYLQLQRNLRIRMLDGSVKTLQVDETKNIGELMKDICVKIGISNHDEYGLCHEELEEPEEPKDSKPVTGTLTLKRKVQQKERDAKMEQLSKKLKTDDNVEWLDHHKTLREMGVDPKETLLLKRRLFYSDRNVDSRDPVQLNLLYVQTRDAILDGRHPVTESQALEFAALQCQIVHGDYQEDRLRPGLVEIFAEYLPEEYAESWGVEKKVFKMYRQYVGLNPLDAKYLYVKTARDLPTYGVTFFLVKEKQKGKKKLVPRLLGINSESILRLDEVTKEVLQVWPLTQVKTYHVGKNDTFTLNFGDYSDKEYSVKTNDAHRIRDILEGYIDIIKRRMGNPYGVTPGEGGAICEENLSPSRSNIITHTNHGSSKSVEHSFVGPSKILPYEQGCKAAEGAHVMTVQQVVIANPSATQHRVVTSEVAMRSDLPNEFIKKLNRMNANAVKFVSLLVDPTEDDMIEAQQIIETMEAELPEIIDGIKTTADKQSSDSSRKELLKQLDSLCKYIDTLTSASKKEEFDAERLLRPAKKIADLTTKMCFSIDPITKRRSGFLRRSRQSFIATDKTEATMRRASIISASASALGSLSAATNIISMEYNGPPLTEKDLRGIEVSALEHMSALNAAMAKYLAAYSDPKNEDQTTALTAMNSISELLPELAKDAQALSHMTHGKSKQALLDEVRGLFDAVRHVCALPDTDNEKMHEVMNNYAAVSKKLVYVLGGRNRRLNPDKENEIIDLSSNVGDLTTVLLVNANILTGTCQSGPGAQDVDNAGVVCADAARDVITVAQLTAPLIYEPHCQNVLTTALETLQLASHCLTITWRPLVEGRAHRQTCEDLTSCTSELNRAIERLKSAYTGYEVNDQAEDEPEAVPQPSPLQTQRLRYAASITLAQETIKGAEHQLNKHLSGVNLNEHQVKELEGAISKKMAEVNSLVATILQAKSDPLNPDYESAEQALRSISELMPGIVNDTRALVCSCAEDSSREGMAEDVRAWCRAVSLVCAGVGRQDHNQELNKSAQEFAAASQKLLFVFSPRANKAREQLLLELGSQAHGRAAQMSSDSHAMADKMRGAGGARLHEDARRLAARAHVLQASVQLTAPSIQEPHSRSVLLTSVDTLSETTQQLMSDTLQLQDDETGCRVLNEKLDKLQHDVLRHGRALEHHLEEIRVACTDVTNEESERQEYIANASVAQDSVAAAEELLKKPVAGPSIQDEDEIDALQSKFSKDLAKVNAALLSMVLVKSNPPRPDYESAGQGIETITQLMSGVVKDCRALCPTRASRVSPESALQAVAEWCGAAGDICADAAGKQDKDLDECVKKFANAANKLSCVFSPSKNAAKEQKIIHVCEAACERSQQVIEAAHLTASAQSGPAARALTAWHNQLRHAVRELHVTAQLTAPTIHEKHSQSVLAATIKDVITSARHLLTDTDILEDHLGRRLVEEVKNYKEYMKTVFEEVRGICQSYAADAAARKVEEDNKKKQQLVFARVVKDADSTLHSAQEELKKVYSSKSGHSKLNLDQGAAIQKQMEQKLAHATAAAATLLASQHPDSMDYDAAAESMRTLINLLPQIVKDTSVLASVRDEKSKRLLLEEMLALCEATAKICSTAREGKEKLNECTIAFGDKAARLLYIISTDVDPAQERQVLARAKAIGENASRLALEGARVVELGSAPAQDICDAGHRCAHSAGNLLYTAKLVGPSIQYPECETALITASDNLSSHVKTLISSWEPLSSDPEHSRKFADLMKEADSLEKLLENLRNDLGEKKLVKPKPVVEKLVIEDTALRQLAFTILDDAKTRAESSHTRPEHKKDFANYSNRLADAIRALDLANSRCKQGPQDIERRRELENAIQGLQFTLLQSRPSHGDQPQNNIVDLTDYVREVSSKAERLTDAANNTKISHGRKALDKIKDRCHNINLEAFRLTNPSAQQQDNDDTLDDMLEVDRFGQLCDSRIKDIDATIQGIDDKHARGGLKERTARLAESCNLLKFATKSALATAQSAVLDEAFDDLMELEKRIDKMLLPADAENTGFHKGVGGGVWCVRGARARVAAGARSAARGGAQDAAPALAAYAAELRAATTAARAHNPQAQPMLKEHIQKLLSLLKSLTVATSMRVEMWQPLDSPEIVAITQQILQELENPKVSALTNGDKPPTGVLDEAYIGKLLLPSEDGKIQGDRKDIESSLQQAATKLSSVAGTVVLSAATPQSLTRSAHAAVDVAAQLANTARALKTDDPIHNKRIEEASQEMSFATYNLLKTAELVSQEPNNVGSRRRLHDACRALNDAINKLARTTSSTNKLHKDCRELHRSLQMQQNLLQSSQPSCALPYADCVDALHNQNEIMQKMKNDELVPREEFSKSLCYVTAAVCNSAEHASQCAYLLSISEHSKHVAKEGLVDVSRIQKTAGAAHESCVRIMRTGNIDQVRDEESKLNKQIEELKQVVIKAADKAQGDAKLELTESVTKLDGAAKALHTAVGQKEHDIDAISTSAMTLLDAIGSLTLVAERPDLVPKVGAVSKEVKLMSGDVMDSSKALISKTQALLKKVESHKDQENMTWVMFGDDREDVLKAFEALLNCLRLNGQRAGLVEVAMTQQVEEETEAAKKSHIQIQLSKANKWLQRRPLKPEIQAAGGHAAQIIIDIAKDMSEDLHEPEKEEMNNLVTDTQQLLEECSGKYDSEKSSTLMERLRELCKAIERGVVSRVVDDFIEDNPLEDLETFVDAERDENKRKFLLEQKIAELMAQLGRVTRTARFVADAATGNPNIGRELKQCSEHTTLLAPVLVQAAEERVSRPSDAAAVANYQRLLAQYSDNMARVRDLCDQTIDPMDFVQTAGETMQRMREESSQQNDPQRCAYTSIAIRRLATRVIHVGMSSTSARKDPELRKALAEAQQKLKVATPDPGMRASRLPDWKDTTAEIMRATGEVELVLGGENIFNKQPEPDQPIYNAALDLHAAVREWSARDNEIVAVAKRMAVLMARLSHYMNTDKTRDLIATSKSIVTESDEVARLAKKLALECTDMRIRTNLLQVCDRVPTISGQLKMLTTIKSSSLGHQDTEEDKEAMNMLVGNAQNLMMSVQEVVKAAVSASVKIASQSGGPRMRWVRKNYY